MAPELQTVTTALLRRCVARVAENAKTAAERHPTLTAGVGYLLIAMALFHELVFQGRVLFERDIHLFWYTQVESFVRIVTAPAWPLWDPYTAFGQPLLADTSAQILYPPTWLNLLMRPWAYYSLFVVMHTWWAGLGLWRLARTFGFSFLAAFTSGALWMASGPLLSSVNLYHHFAGACWMSWVLLAAESSFRSPRFRQVALWALAASLQILAGSADMCALTALAMTALLVRRILDSTWGDVKAMLVRSTTAAALAAAITTALWWPALEAVRHSERSALPEWQRTYWSVHPWSLIETVYPLSQRLLPLSQTLGRLLYEGREPFLASMYLGLPVIALVLAAPLARDRRVFWTLVSLCGLALAFALGRYTPFHAALSTVLPFLRVFRYPQKATLLVALSIALLAGLGLDAWRAPNERQRHLMRCVVVALSAVVVVGWGIVLALRAGLPLAIDGFAAADAPRAAVAQRLAAVGGRVAVSAGLGTVALLALALRRPAGLLRFAFVAVAALCDLAFQHRDLNATTAKEFYLLRPAVLASLPTGDHSRLYVYDYVHNPSLAQLHLGRNSPYAPTRAVKGWSQEELGELAARDALSPPLAGTWAREGSFEADYRGLAPSYVMAVDQKLLAEERTPAWLKLLRIGAVSHVVTLHTTGLENLERVASIPSLIAEPTRVWRVPGALARCYVVSGARPADGEAATAALVDPTFDPATSVVLTSGEAAAADPSFKGVCHIDELGPDVVRLSVSASSAAHMVLVDAYDPGWRATVDGGPAEVKRANVAFRAVQLTAGEHRVTLFYRPRSVVLGSVVSSVGLVLTLGLLLGAPRKRNV